MKPKSDVKGVEVSGEELHYIKDATEKELPERLKLVITERLTAQAAEHDRVKEKLMDDIILLQNKFLEAKAEKAELEKKVIEAIPTAFAIASHIKVCADIGKNYYDISEAIVAEITSEIKSAFGDGK